MGDRCVSSAVGVEGLLADSAAHGSWGGLQLLRRPRPQLPCMYWLALPAVQGYYGEMPWLAVPYADEKRREALNKAFRVMGVPSLFIVGPDGRLITAHGRVAVSQDPEGKNFPWEGVTATNE